MFRTNRFKMKLSLQLVFRKAFPHLGAWILSASYWFVSRLGQTLVCRLARSVSPFPRLCLRASLIIVSNNLLGLSWSLFSFQRVFFVFCFLIFPLYALFLACLASGLAQYDLVSHLLSVLTSPHLEPEDRLSILLTISHCTDASGERAAVMLLQSYEVAVFPLL